jgi:hypothetical protein
MPGEEGLGLHNEERLCPVPDGSRKQQQEESIGLATRWALDLTTEDDQLLTEQRVLGDEFSPGAGQIVQCSYQVRAVRWFRPPRYMLLDSAE